MSDRVAASTDLRRMMLSPADQMMNADLWPLAADKYCQDHQIALKNSVRL
ncbi:hypothetical protein CFter6_3429 [Collimonas fungivorans]|uniref:Uncharacterized protein n=1 Tax=Collimonas fungivorans TaxID=158899 RepID=A0A127PE21_9BURK|nr:hypothetical protein CFter6_3429 [Collimonas fungivorans]